MRVADFSFDLPDNLIANYPHAQRSGCRLLCLDGPTGQIEHRVFHQLVDQLQAGDLLVFNNTRVIPARLFGQKQTGGKIEVLVERILDNQRVLAHIRSSKSPKVGSQLLFTANDYQISATMQARHQTLFELVFAGEQDILTILDQIGHMPLPPYIARPDEKSDQEQYQTVYSQIPGAVAAPTAGLHFDQPLLAALKAKGVAMEFVTLHVGAGTFQPVRVEQLTDHQMHSEYAQVSDQVVQAVLACKARGNRVIAVGTTSVRCLESAAKASATALLAPFAGDTDIFIYPGYHYQVVDGLITNFHLPQSTLLMLVCAFAGYQHTLAAYQQAIAEQYRFYSYGDAMLISRNPAASQEVIGQPTE